MHLQQDILFDLWHWPFSFGSRAQKMFCSTNIPPTSCDLCNCKVWSCYVQRSRRCIYKKIHYLTFALGVEVTQNVAQYPLHHVNYAPAGFEVAMSNGSGGDAFKRKYIVWTLSLNFGSTSQKMFPSTLYTPVTYVIAKFEVAMSKVKEEMHLQANTLFDLCPWGKVTKKSCSVPSTSCDLCTWKVYSCYVQWFRGRCIYKKIHYLILGLDL